VPKGLKQNADLLKLLGKMKRTLKDRGQEVRWTPPDFWHVTLQFLGEMTDTDDRVQKVLSDWSPRSSCLELSLQGLGAFPADDAARVLWVGVQASQEFLDLQSELTARLEATGLVLQDREFKPHLTLARFRQMISVRDLIELGGRKHFGTYPIGELVLFDSVLQGQIIKYVPRFRHPLQ